MPGRMLAKDDLGAQWKKHSPGCAGQCFHAEVQRSQLGMRGGRRGSGKLSARARVSVLNLIRAEFDIEPLYHSLSHLVPR